MRIPNTLAVIAALPLLFACTPSDELGDDSETSGGEPEWPSIASELPRDLDPDATADERSALADDQQQLALDLYHLLRAEAPAGEGFAVSAYSLQAAFGMLYAGTVGQAQSEMKATMHFSLDDERQHVALNWQDLELAARNLDAVDTPGEVQDPVVLRTANGIWITRDLEPYVKQDYLDRVAVHYGAEVYLADFSTDESAELERLAVNEWVSLRTNELIPELFKPGMFNAGTTAVLANALYLKAPWSVAFEESATSPQDFHLVDGSTATVDMMYAYALEARYGQGPGYAALGVPLRGGALEVVFVLPDGELADFEATLDQPTLGALLDDMSFDVVTAHLPRFVLTTDLDLTLPLQGALGMPAPFEDPSSFDGIVEGLGIITSVVHQTVIEVAEDGVEAAAATGIVVGDTGSEEPTPNWEFRADRPFVVMIYDRPTDSVLFLGRVLDPRA